ncbi:hypothetical protein MBLNU230_g3492t1 [Neophaeotheca triangularis]
MALATSAALASAGAAAAAYLNGKYHISQDLRNQRIIKRAAQDYQRRVAQRKTSLWYYFEEQCARIPTSDCLWYRASPESAPVQYDWQTVYAQACRYGQFLLQEGVRPLELCAVYLQNSPEFLMALLGSWSVGSAPALINYNLAGDSLVHCLRLSGSKVLFVDEDAGCRERIEEVRERLENELGIRIVVLDKERRDAIAALEPTRPDDAYRKVVPGDFPMSLIYTSGSTGLPKACPFQVQRSFAMGTARMESVGLQSNPNGDRWYDCMPMYHGTGGTVAVGCMMSGQTLCIGRKFSVRQFWSDVRESRATAFVYVGETARYLLASPSSPLDKQHTIQVMFGNGMRPDVWNRFKERFAIPRVVEFFNSTEGMLMLQNVCDGPFNDAHVGHQGAISRWQTRNTFFPVQIDVDGDTIWRDPKTGSAKRVPYEQGGEIVIKMRSEGDFVGYWNNPEGTEKRFERNLFEKGDLYYRTGDALRRDEDGRWYFLDRLGDSFRWKSENVSTSEVAQTMGEFPRLLEANVYGVELPCHDGRAGCAAVYIAPEERESFDYAGLLAHCRKKLPKYAVPVFLRVIKNPTPMHNNKQNKVPLRKEGVDPSKVANGEAGNEDRILWAPPSASTYTPLGQAEWDAIVGGKARL